MIPLVGKIDERKYQGDKKKRMRQEPDLNKRMTPSSTQNFKALDLWVFFLIWCSTFSYLLNVGLRLTLRYLTPFPRLSLKL